SVEPSASKFKLYLAILRPVPNKEKCKVVSEQGKYDQEQERENYPLVKYDIDYEITEKDRKTWGKEARLYLKVYRGSNGDLYRSKDLGNLNSVRGHIEGMVGVNRGEEYRVELEVLRDMEK